MTEVVVAVFESASAADAAIEDLQTARVPSAVVNRYIARGEEERISPTARSGAARGSPLISVEVNESEASAVAGILDQYGALAIRENGPGVG